ncbi:MAG TPA: TRAP transporter substrate-binding protein DctP [Spirochaetia bacterium]|nr:TRAP transporter substrate-binding protein DctP [Spirochaetia bacterium]
MTVRRALVVLVFAVLSAGGLSAQQYLIKFATLAPEGSTWIKVMRQLDAAVRADSGGRLGFRLYPGGVAGDEKDVIRKIRLGQYSGGGFTGVGVGEVAKKVRILDAPLFFRNYDEVDYIRQKYEKDFEQAFEDGGFVLLGWAEVGFVYVFSSKLVRSFADLRGLKPWMWEGDPIAQSAYQAIGVSPVPLSATDVMTSLQTGMVDAVYASPYTLIALQWFTRVSYAMSQPLADALGAAIVSRKLFDSLPQDLQEILLRDSRKLINQLTASSRQDNAKAIETLKSRGMKFIPAPPDIASEFDQVGRKARQLLVGTLYSQEFLSDVENALAEYRAQHPDSK